MSRPIIALSHEQRTSLDLDAFMIHADALNQHHREAFTTPFPKAPGRWLAPYHFPPRPLTLPPDGDVEGGRSWLVGATIDCSFTRAICAPNSGAKRCPHGYGVRGDSRRMTFTEHPRLIGPMQRGSPAWQRLYRTRPASARTKGYDQDVIGGGGPPRRRGLGAFRVAGALRPLAQLLRRALNFVLNVTSTLGRLVGAPT
jgi:hypothetical protein